MQWKNVYVFISSTFSDMHAERDYLVKNVFPELSEWCEERRIRLVDIDLRWGVTRADSEAKNALLACLKNIDECRPFFLCFLGQRRGWIPLRADVSAATIKDYPGLEPYLEKSSVTEMEIEHALLAPMLRTIGEDESFPSPVSHALFYLRKDGYLANLTDLQKKIYTNAGLSDAESQDAELASFKDRIKSRSDKVTEYDCRFDSGIISSELLSEGNEAARGRLTDFSACGRQLRELIIESLKAEIEKEYPAQAFRELSTLEAGLEQQELFMERSREGYIPRSGDFDELDAHISSLENGLFILSAPTGLGKTMLLSNFVTKLRTIGKKVTARFCGASDLFTDGYGLWKSVFDEYEIDCPPNYSELRRNIADLLSALAEKGENILILDAVNQLSDGAEMLTWLPRALPAGLKILISIKEDETSLPLIDRLKGESGVTLSAVHPFTDKKDRYALIEAYLERYLECDNNLITSLTLTGTANLTELRTGNNKLSTLNIASLTKLQTFYCYNNELSELDLSPFPLLARLDCQANNLTELDLSDNPQLTDVSCRTNDIITLTVGTQTHLNTLSCDSCELSSLDLSGCTALQYFYCYGNKLSFSELPLTLPVSGGEFSYSPQQAAIAITLTNGNRVDLSDEELFNSNHTSYTWYKASDNSQITSGVELASDGVFVFDRETFADLGVYCKLSNNSFPDLAGENALQTVSVTILNLPQLSTPTASVVDTTVSWTAIENAESYLVRIQQSGSNVCDPISTTSTSINLALLPDKSYQTLPSGSYDVSVKSVADSETHVDSGYSFPTSSVTLSTKTALQQVNEAATANDMKTALEANKTEFGITDSISGTAAANEYADLTADGKAALCVEMIAGQPYANNDAVTAAFAAVLKHGVLADEAAKYETAVTLAFDETRIDGADVESLVRVLKTGMTENTDVTVTNRYLLTVSPNTVSGAMLSAGADYVKAPMPNWTGQDGTATVRFTYSFSGETENLDVTITIKPVPASIVMLGINNAASAAEAETLLDTRGNRNSFGAGTAYVDYWDDENSATSDFTAAEKLAVAASVFNSGTDYAMNTAGKTALITAYEAACKQVFIESAKTIIGTAFAAVEGVDTKLIESLELLDGMSDTGVTIAIDPSTSHPCIANADGAITYASTERSAGVTLGLTFDGLTDSTKTITVSVPAKDETAPTAGGSGVITSSNITSSSVKLTWEKADDTVTPNSELKYFVVKSTEDNISTSADVLANGTVLNAGGTPDISTYTVTGLSAGTKYYFNVAAVDRMGNTVVYTEVAVTASPADGGGSGSASTGTSIDITNSDGTGSISGTVSKTKDGVRVTIDGDDFGSFVGNGRTDVVINTGNAVVTFDSHAAGFIGEAAGSGEISLSIEQAEDDLLSTLSEEELALIGDRPVYDFTLTVGGSELSQWDGGHVSISIPYAPQPGEDINALVVYYIDDEGHLQYVKGSYNEETGTVDFTVEHFSLYAVGYNKVTFADVTDSAWYYNAVNFCAARGITTGVSNNSFAPEDSITRGQFLVMLMRAYGIAPDEKPTDNFTDSGNTYYTGYLAAAKRLGISNGVGDNMYSPELKISRQDMFTLLYRTLNILGELPVANTGKTLANFSDSDSISDYALAATEKLVSCGLVVGSDGQLNPGDNSTRAQLVQVLYKLLST
ncbi:MAG: DUF4062 domain-containing protein [Clostridia bacterium]|nr:DUF4062 domain-containing protein [Clostridia bacterium]